jgi:hypothetical protein
MSNDKNLQEIVPRHSQGHLLCREENLERSAEDGAAQSEDLKAAFEKHETETDLRRYSRRSTSRRGVKLAMPSWALSRKARGS